MGGLAQNQTHVISNPYPTPKLDKLLKTGLFYCESCDRDMDAKDKQNHLRSKKHASAVTNVGLAASKSTATSTWVEGQDTSATASGGDGNWGGNDTSAAPAPAGEDWSGAADSSNNDADNGFTSVSAPRPRTNGCGSDKGCFNCGGDHLKRDCPQMSGSGGGAGDCYGCGKPGHQKRECPEARNGGGDRACFNCGNTGHQKRDCPNPSSSNGGGGGGRACFNCGETGHQRADCYKPYNPNMKRDYSKIQCHNCQGFGHTKSRCTQSPAGNAGGDGGFSSNGGFDDPATTTDFEGGSGSWDDNAGGEATGGTSSWDNNY